MLVSRCFEVAVSAPLMVYSMLSLVSIFFGENVLGCWVPHTDVSRPRNQGEGPQVRGARHEGGDVVVRLDGDVAELLHEDPLDLVLPQPHGSLEHQQLAVFLFRLFYHLQLMFLRVCQHFLKVL